MRSFLLCSCLVFLSIYSKAQNTKWLNYANDHIIYDMALEGDLLWVATQGGLVKIDRVTGERQIFQPWNSGLRGLGAQSIAIAPDGAKWIGGDYGGLFRFDGESWEHFYEVNTGDTLLQILNLEFAPNGDLWFFSNVNGNCGGCRRLLSFNGTDFTRHDQNLGPQLTSASFIRDFTFDSSGNVWAANEFEIFKYNGFDVLEKFDSTNTPLSKDTKISALEMDSEGNLWVSARANNSAAKILKFDGTDWTVAHPDAPSQCNKIFEDYEGNIWFTFRQVNQNGRFDGNSWTFWTGDDLPGVPAFFNGPEIITVDENGHWWVILYNGIHEKKLYEFDGTNWTGFNTEFFPMASNYWSSIAYDCENRVWLGGSGVVNVFDGTTWVEYTSTQLGGKGNVRSIVLDENTCDIYLSFVSGNDGIGYSKFDGSNFIPQAMPNNNGGAFKTKFAPDGTLWVGSTSHGLGKFNGTSWTWYNNQNSILTNSINHFDIDEQGNLWICSPGKGLVRFDGVNSWQQFNGNNSPIGDYTYWVFIDESGMIWTHYLGGVARFDEMNWAMFPTPAGHVYGLTENENHDFWVSGTNGAFLWDGSNFTAFDFVSNPIISGYVQTTMVDNFGNAWFVHSKGISVYNENGISNQLTSPTPGARGTVFYDLDQNGQMATTNEPTIPGQKVWLQPQNLLSFTNSTGKYTFYPAPGDYEVNYGTENPYLPTTANPLAFEMADQPIDGLDFGVWTSELPDSVSLDLTAGFARCNEPMNLWATFCNYGILDADGTVEITFDPLLEYVSAFPIPQSVLGNVVTFSFEDLSYFDCQTVKIVLQVPGVEDLGEILQFNGTGTAVFGGEIVSTAHDDAQAEIACSFDPNDKRSEATGDHVDEFSLLGDPLDFTIRFQNKGNDTAFIVVIRDTLDANLDHSSLQVVASSHDMETLLDANGLLTFTFRNINLLWEAVDEPGSQGFVKYRIAPKAGLPDPTEIRNTAHIYFDLNPPIITNTTQNVLVETLPFSSTISPQRESSLLAYPNPTSGGVWVEFRTGGNENLPWQLAVHDLTGRTVLLEKSIAGRYRVEGLSPGFYVVTALREGRKESLKIVVGR